MLLFFEVEGRAKLEVHKVLRRERPKVSWLIDFIMNNSRETNKILLARPERSTLLKAAKEEQIWLLYT